MVKVRDVDDIQLNEDLAFLRREWRAQRFGWLGMGLVIALALLGVCGRGPLSSKERGSRSSFAVSYDRMIRHGALTAVEFHVGAGVPRDSVLKLFISNDYLAHFNIVSIVPDPVASGTSGSLAYFVFGRSNNQQAARVLLHVQPTGYGWVDAVAALQGAEPIRFKQFIFP